MKWVRNDGAIMPGGCWLLKQRMGGELGHCYERLAWHARRLRPACECLFLSARALQGHAAALVLTLSSATRPAHAQLAPGVLY